MTHAIYGIRRYQRGQTEIVKSEDRKDHGQHRTRTTTLKTKAGVTRSLQTSG